MAADIRLIASGTTYYLINSTGTPSAGGAATAASTTPYMVLDDPDAGFVWGLNTSPRPATPYGSSSFGWPDVVDQPMYIAVAGTNHDTVASNIRQLYQIFNRANYDKPVQLYFSPNGATNPIYFNIQDAQIDLVNDQVNPFSGVVNAAVARVTITRSPFGGRLTTPETLISGVSFGNVGTGAPDNIDAFTTGSGDMIYDGSPCNYLISSTNAGAGDPIRQTILASITSRTYYAPAVAWSTSGTTFATGANSTITSAHSFSGIAEIPRLRVRLLAVIASGYTGNPEFRFRINTSSSSAGTIYSSVIPAVNGDGQTTIRFLDSGPMPITFQALKGLTDYTVQIQLNTRSTDGAATTGTVSSVEVLLYYDFCNIRTTGVDYGSGTPFQVMSVSSFAEQSGEALLPLPYPQAFVYKTSDSTLHDWGEIRGTVPRYYSGASLYVKLIDASGVTSGNCYVTTTRTMTVTATHAPLYRLLRGAG